MPRAVLSGVLVAAAPAHAAAPFEAAWRSATVDGCLAAVAAGAAVDGAPLGLVPAPDLSLPYSVPATVWRDSAGRFAVAGATLPGGRRLCEAHSLRALPASTVNATYSAFLDWAGAAAKAGRYRFLGTRQHDTGATGTASLASTFATPAGHRVEVTFTAQPLLGRVAFAAQEIPPEALP